jgi:hypothetical protein
LFFSRSVFYFFFCVFRFLFCFLSSVLLLSFLLSFIRFVDFFLC